MLNAPLLLNTTATSCPAVVQSIIQAKFILISSNVQEGFIVAVASGLINVPVALPLLSTVSIRTFTLSAGVLNPSRLSFT